VTKDKNHDVGGGKKRERGGHKKKKLGFRELNQKDGEAKLKTVKI